MKIKRMITYLIAKFWESGNTLPSLLSNRRLAEGLAGKTKGAVPIGSAPCMALPVVPQRRETCNTTRN